MVSLIAWVKVMLRRLWSVKRKSSSESSYTNRAQYIRLTTKIHVTLMMTSAQVVEHQSLLLTKRQSFLDYTIKCQGSLSQDGDRYTVYNGCS